MEFGRKYTLRRADIEGKVEMETEREMEREWKKKSKVGKRLRHLHFQLGRSLSMTVYLVRAAIISAGRRHATPVIDKRLHLHCFHLCQYIETINIYMPLLVGLVKTTCCLVGLLPFNHHWARCEKTENAGRVWGHIITAVEMPNSWLL